MFARQHDCYRAAACNDNGLSSAQSRLTRRIRSDRLARAPESQGVLALTFVADGVFVTSRRPAPRVLTTANRVHLPRSVAVRFDNPRCS
jgi:hypothetical protein